MAFFDKLNDLAKSVKDAANDAVETTRIKSRISSEKRAVDEACRKLIGDTDVFRPDREAHAAYREKFAAFKRLYADLK